LLEAQELVDRVPEDERWRLEVFMEPARQIASELRQMAAPLAFQATMPEYTTAIFEGAQGVLLDEWRGFHPHTTWSTVTLHHALAMVEESEAEEVCTLGVTRAYMTRHGAGPLPTWSRELDAQLSDPGNPTNAWQGTIRRGWLDLVLLRYAVEAVGGPLDGLVLNCLDHLADVSPKICVGYRLAQDVEIERLPVSSVPWLAAQERFAMLLERVEPVYRQISLTAVPETLARALVPIAITGSGPAWQDRTLRELRFRRWGIAQPVNSRISGHWHDRADILGLLDRNVVV
jgi:adenylosuccinate synthase